jgi:hypothetical protein
MFIPPKHGNTIGFDPSPYVWYVFPWPITAKSSGWYRHQKLHGTWPENWDLGKDASSSVVECTKRASYETPGHDAQIVSENEISHPVAYPLVISYSLLLRMAHRNSGYLPMNSMVIFHSELLFYQRVTPAINGISRLNPQKSPGIVIH